MEIKTPALDPDDAERAGRVRNPEQLLGAFAKLFGGDDSAVRGDLVSQLKTLAGTSTRTSSGVDIRRVAELTGKSERAIRRWVNEGVTPSSVSLSAIRSGQRHALAAQASTRGVSQAGYLRVRAQQGPTRSGNDYLRERTAGIPMTPQQYDQLAQIYRSQGEVAAMAWVEQQLQTSYMQGWQVDSWDVQGGGMWFE